MQTPSIDLDPVQHLARRASGVEFCRDEPRERQAASWRLAAYLTHFGREQMPRVHQSKNAMAGV